MPAEKATRSEPSDFDGKSGTRATSCTGRLSAFTLAPCAFLRVLVATGSLMVKRVGPSGSLHLIFKEIISEGTVSVWMLEGGEDTCWGLVQMWKDTNRTEK
jgi:hypothetical protein